jgi:chitinase
MSRACSILDFINLMAYDFSEPWSSQPGHHAALYSPSSNPGLPSAHAAIRYLQSLPGVSLRKFLLGVPCYGRAFATALGTGAPSSESGEKHGQPVDVRDLPLSGMEEYMDDEACAAYCIPSDGTAEWVSYDNATTVRTKARYVRQNQLGGLVFWEATQDHQNNEKSLVLAGYLGLYDMASNS